MLLSQPTTHRFGTRSFQERATSMNLATHGLRAAVGLPPRVMRRAGGNTPRRALAVRAEITRIPAPDGSVERRGVTFKTPVPFDAAAAKTGIMHVGVGGFHRSHQLVRVPRNSPRAHPARRARPVAFTVPETSHSARKPRPEMSRKTPKGRATDARGRAARREARRAESRVTFCVSHGDRLCLAVPRCGPARAPPAPRAATESDGFGRSQSENVEAKFPSDSVSRRRFRPAVADTFRDKKKTDARDETRRRLRPRR